jgi:DNA-binding transcriptional ArsR family regulator
MLLVTLTKTVSGYILYMQSSAYRYKMNQHTYRQAAQLHRLLSHPARLHILDELRRDEACVCHLQAVLGRPQAYVSQQLRVLREAGVVIDRKDGLLVYYRLADRQQVVRMLEDTLGPAGEPTRLPGCPCPKCSPETFCA